MFLYADKLYSICYIFSQFKKIGDRFQYTPLTQHKAYVLR